MTYLLKVLATKMNQTATVNQSFLSFRRAEPKTCQPLKYNDISLKQQMDVETT
jgi:hypothetical protein